MSPTEAELRAFLHDGEGESPDATSVISQALRIRYERRRRINTVLSSAAVIAVVTTGLTFLFTRGDGESADGPSSAGGGIAASAPEAHSHAPAPLRKPKPSGSSQKLGPASRPVGGSGGGGANGSYRDDARSAHAAVAGAACPLSPTSYALPGGGGLKSHGADEPMFPRRPAGVKVCAYSMESGGGPESEVLSARAIHTVVRVIENSPKLPGPSRACPAVSPDAGRRIQIISVDAAGRRMRAVTITLGACGPARVTNGTSVRYLDRLPASLRKLIEPGSPPR